MWYANIHCRIKEGRAYLADPRKVADACNGECCFCDSFRGVDISQGGKALLCGCCIKR